MTADDDRTVIRPLSPTDSLPGAQAPGVSPSTGIAATPTVPAGPVDDDRTLITPLRAAPVAASPAAAAPDPRPGAPDMGNGLPVGTRLGEFELTSVLGEGGFGIVYLAQDHSLGRLVALKEYMPSVLAARVGMTQVQVRSERHRETFDAGMKSFINEAKLLAQFDHPSLVKVYRFWEANGTAYMVMPFYEGKTLKDTLREMGSPPSEDWLRTLLNPLTEALAVVHGEQCYHRDIAPDNVMMLAGSQRPLLLDFGAARRVIGDMTQALTVILKPGYAPVEQYAEIPGMKQGPWTDVYALAAVVHFAITGRTPPPSVGRLMGDTYVPLVQAAAGRYSPGFLAAVDKALSVKPEARTQTVAQLRADMGLGGSTAMPAGGASARLGAAAAAGATAPAPGPAPGGAGRKTGVLVGGGVAALVALGVAGYALMGGPAAPPVTASAPPPAPAPASLPAPAPAPTPAPPAPAAPPVAAAPVPFNIGSEFERVVQAQTEGFAVEAVPNKTALRIDRDELRFTISSAREGYLYVLLYGSDGGLMMLYPNDTAGQQKVRKGQKLALPKSPIVFNTVGPPGGNMLLVMVSQHQRDFRDLQPRKDGPFRVFPAGADAQRIAATLPAGPIPAQAGKVICPDGAAGCADEYGAAIMRVDAVN